MIRYNGFATKDFCFFWKHGTNWDYYYLLLLLILPINDTLSYLLLLLLLIIPQYYYHNTRFGTAILLASQDATSRQRAEAG